MKKWLNEKKRLRPTLSAVFVLIYIVYFAFGFFHLSKFVTTDEIIFWVYNRVPQYWSAVKTGDLVMTNINDKPGVSTAIISGIGYNIDKEGFQESIAARVQKYSYRSVEGIYPNIERNLLAMRLPILIFNAFFSLLLFWLIKKITGSFGIAFWSFVFILFSPILLGISQIINPDSLLWSFSTASLLAFIAYLKSEEKSLAIISSVSLGMALLSKYTAVIFFPFFIITTFIYFSYKLDDWRKKGENIAKKIKKITLTTMAIMVGAIFLYALLMPAVFLKPALLYEGTIGFSGMPYFLGPLFIIQLFLLIDAIFLKNKIVEFIFKYVGIFLKKYSGFIYAFLAIIFLLTLLGWMEKLSIVPYNSFAFDLRENSKRFLKLPIYSKTILEARPLVFSLTPVVLIFLIYFWIKSSFKKSFNFFLFVLSLFFIVFYAAVIFQGLLVTIRYSIMLYPLAAILAAMGIMEIFSTEKIKKVFKIFAFIAILIFSFVSLWFTKPFYFNYTNFFLPKNYIITDAWGYGGYEAAQYLNSLPEAENLTIWADYSGVCEFTKGSCSTSKNTKNVDIDYFVLTRRGKIIYPLPKNKTDAKQYYSHNDYVWRLDINNRPKNYVKIFKNETALNN